MIRTTLILCWSTVASVAALLTLPGSIELLLLSMAALIPRRRTAAVASTGAWRVAVVVPAHNEESGIAGCVLSLLQADSAGTEVVILVVADNCTDDTAGVADAAGAQVLVRTDAANRGKGHALHYAFTTLIQLGYDCMLVVDADSRVAPNFIASSAGALQAGAAAVQSRYLVHNASETTRSRLMGFALRAFNVVRPLGRDSLGLSCGIFGNGFGLRRETLLAVPYLATSLVEDLEYHISLVRSGRRVAFLNDTTVYAEMPVKVKDAKTQRSRWEGGRLRMLALKAPSLVSDVVAGRLRCLEPLLELLLLPLAFHAILIAIAISAPLAMVRDAGLAGALIILLHLAATMAIGGSVRGDARTLLTAPFYVLWKILLIPTLLASTRSNKKWVRTGRNADVTHDEPQRKHL